jgi:hypothetical protein
MRPDQDSIQAQGGITRQPRNAVVVTLVVGTIVALAITGALALWHRGSPAAVTPSSAAQQAALHWTQDNQQMWSWMQSHWSEMGLMHEHWGDTAWMRTHLPDWGWMQVRWGSMTWMHENWQAMTWMRAGGMMGGSVPGGMLGQP